MLVLVAEHGVGQAKVWPMEILGEKSAFGQLPAFLSFDPTAWEIPLATRLPKHMAPCLQALDSQTAFPLPRALSHTRIIPLPLLIILSVR